jgi:hypothetical protein
MKFITAVNEAKNACQIYRKKCQKKLGMLGIRARWSVVATSSTVKMALS